MKKPAEMIRRRSFLAASIVVFALAFSSSLFAETQVTVTHVRVTLSPAPGSTAGLVTAKYCDTGTPCAGGIQVWNLGTGIALGTGETLVLTQTGLVSAGGNFDTSDRILGSTATLADCENPNSGCKVDIEIDTGSGLSNVFTSSAGNPINNFNGETGSSQEQAQWTSPVFSAVNFTLQLGYADNEHGCTAPATGTTSCFPNPFDGSAGTSPATVFLGHGVSISSVPNCGTNCYDGGALLITGINPNLLTAACMGQTVGQMNVPYSSFVGASGGTLPYKFTLNSGSLPPGLTLNPATGEISGTPATAQTFNFTVKVADSGTPVRTAITDECGIVVVPQHLFILKEGPDAVPISAVFDFTMRVENNGPAPQLQVSVIDQLPADGYFISSQPPGFFASQGVLTIPLGYMPPGASTTVIVTWQAPQRESRLVNSASVFSSSSSAGPSMADVQVRQGAVTGKIDDVQAVAAGTGLRNRTGNTVNRVKVDGIITIPPLASFAKVQKAFLVWTVLFQGNAAGVVNKGIADKISNNITFEGKLLDGINATKPLNPNEKNPKAWQLWSGPLCWPDLNNGKLDNATAGFVADVTAIVQGKPPNAANPTSYIVSDPVNGANRVGNPNGNNPAPVFPVTDGASLFIFYTIEGQPKTQLLFDFQYDSNYFKTVERRFTGVNVNLTAPEIILAGPDGQKDAPDRTKFRGNPNTKDVLAVVKDNLWNGSDPLQYGAFPIGNLWDTLTMKLPPVLRQKTPAQTLEILLAPSNDPVNLPKGDCVGISGAVLVTPQ